VDSLLEQSLRAVIAVTHAGLIRVAHAVESSSDPILLTMQIGYGSVHRIDACSARAAAPALERAQP
jgi:hypothetical protein